MLSKHVILSPFHDSVTYTSRSRAFNPTTHGPFVVPIDVITTTDTYVLYYNIPQAHHSPTTYNIIILCL